MSFVVVVTGAVSRSIDGGPIVLARSLVLASSYRLSRTHQNRGIGTAICDGILSASTSKPVILYACSRAGKDLGLKGKVEYPNLDITDKTQIQALVDKIKKDQGGVDVLINNAGVNLDDDYSLETAKQTLETNYKGTLEVSGESLPWLSTRLFFRCQVTSGVETSS
jgi:NAD(P)-dependent dehydrogenase (short-subunit alcohol dehydrogenase family)